jgi:uncharacterized OsmC-like protein
MLDTAVREALEKLTRIFTEQPEKARSKNAAAVAFLREGLRCRVAGPNGEHLETDMPSAMGGGATGPNPGWLLRASLASCEATVIAMRAAQQGITLTALDVTVESESDNRGILGFDNSVPAALQRLSTRVRIGAQNATADELRSLVAWAEEHSPVGCTLRQAEGSAVSVEIV